MLANKFVIRAGYGIRNALHTQVKCLHKHMGGSWLMAHNLRKKLLCSHINYQTFTAESLD